MTVIPNPSLVLNKIDDITFETYEAPEITQPNEVIVEVKKTGICGSDIKYYAHGEIGPFKLKHPMVLGHESAGIVSKIGPGVTTLKVGDRVAIEPGIPSRLSNEYKMGKYHLCPHMCFAATPNGDKPNAPGTLCKYYKSPEDFLFKLPDHVSLELGAMVEPMSVGVHGCKLGGVKFGDKVAVFGAGPVGILTAAAATAMGASKVIIVDIFDHKLQMAKEIGAASHIFNSKTGGDYKDLIKTFDGDHPTVILECSGAEPCIIMGVMAAAPGGRFVQVGNSVGHVKFPITEFATRELILYGSFRYDYGDYQTSINIFDKNYKDGKDKAPIDFERLITHRFKFEDAIKAYDLVRGGNGAVKCLIDGPL
ncbi:XYL2 [[Candida] subhashii]|uniref:XYL2 n=1 Tax=[Candida] subhashii TaxID=561895 RepID=A0A8J5QRD3_9ASCO|nr:XYL2 [[Candida] subhashii]KAG7663877.1 XYL2 [[Candida] subhashii]